MEDCKQGSQTEWHQLVIQDSHLTLVDGKPEEDTIRAVLRPSSSIFGEILAAHTVQPSVHSKALTWIKICSLPFHSFCYNYSGFFFLPQKGNHFYLRSGIPQQDQVPIVWKCHNLLTICPSKA